MLGSPTSFVRLFDVPNRFAWFRGPIPSRFYVPVAFHLFDWIPADQIVIFNAVPFTSRVWLAKCLSCWPKIITLAECTLNSVLRIILCLPVFPWTIKPVHITKLSKFTIPCIGTRIIFCQRDSHSRCLEGGCKSESFKHLFVLFFFINYNWHFSCPFIPPGFLPFWPEETEWAFNTIFDLSNFIYFSRKFDNLSKFVFNSTPSKPSKLPLIGL